MTAMPSLPGQRPPALPNFSRSGVTWKNPGRGGLECTRLRHLCRGRGASPSGDDRGVRRPGRLRSPGASPKVLAWGEIGLDFYYDHSPRDVQQQAFAAQLQRAIRVTCPWSFTPAKPSEPPWTFCRTTRYPAPGVHCFTGTPAMAEQLLAMGFYIGFTGIVSFPKADNVRAALRVVPLERLLIETDSPYLAPSPLSWVT